MGKRPSSAAGAASKRHAADGGGDIGSPLSPTVLSPDYVKQLKAEFAATASKPYSHCVLRGLSVLSVLSALSALSLLSGLGVLGVLSQLTSSWQSRWQPVV